MIELGSRRRTLPAPPAVVFGSLTDPHRAGARSWLALLGGEVEPTVLAADEPTRVVWSSLWPDRPDDRVEIGLAADGGGTALHWTLITPGEEPDAATVGHLRHRLNHLLFADLRFSYGQ